MPISEALAVPAPIASVVKPMRTAALTNARAIPAPRPQFAADASSADRSFAHHPGGGAESLERGNAARTSLVKRVRRNADLPPMATAAPTVAAGLAHEAAKLDPNVNEYIEKARGRQSSRLRSRHQWSLVVLDTAF